MTRGLRQRLAWQAVRTAVCARSAAPPSGRAVLVVLPPDAPGELAGWTFVGRLAVPTDALTIAVAGERVWAVPDRFAGAVVLVDAAACDWRGVPRRDVRARVWARAPGVAVNLAPPSSAAAALLVGACPSAHRIGPDAPHTAGMYDLSTPALPVVDGPLDTRVLTDVLARLRPPVLPLRR